jgi:hypothetical protein
MAQIVHIDTSVVDGVRSGPNEQKLSWAFEIILAYFDRMMCDPKMCVINCSWGIGYGDVVAVENLGIVQQLQAIIGRGAKVVAAAGNDTVSAASPY